LEKKKRTNGNVEEDLGVCHCVFVSKQVTTAANESEKKKKGLIAAKGTGVSTYSPQTTHPETGACVVSTNTNQHKKQNQQAFSQKGRKEKGSGKERKREKKKKEVISSFSC